MEQLLRELLAVAKKDPTVKERLLQTRQSTDPMFAFCEEATKLGYPMTVGELVAIGEEYCSNLLKSVNGGATYPMEDWDDAYEDFFVALNAEE